MIQQKLFVSLIIKETKSNKVLRANAISQSNYYNVDDRDGNNNKNDTYCGTPCKRIVTVRWYVPDLVTLAEQRSRGNVFSILQNFSRLVN